jgi:Fur family ferric uptake transcriptional regulator
MAKPNERQTRQRRAIQEAISEAGAPVSPKEILALAQTRLEGLGMATVYRTLRLLADAGVIQQVEIPGESPRYEIAGKAHHHHFYCRGCGRVFEVDGCPGDFAELAPRGFALDGHELVLFGLCDRCVAKGPKVATSRGRSITQPGHAHDHAHGQVHAHAHDHDCSEEHGLDHATKPAARSRSTPRARKTS